MQDNGSRAAEKLRIRDRQDNLAGGFPKGDKVRDILSENQQVIKFF
jgi:hypothetical protein